MYLIFKQEKSLETLFLFDSAIHITRKYSYTESVEKKISKKYKFLFIYDFNIETTQIERYLVSFFMI